MSLLDKLKSMFSGGSSDGDAHDHSGHDHSGHDHSHEPVAPPMPPADPAGMPTSDAAPGSVSTGSGGGPQEGESRHD